MSSMTDQAVETPVQLGYRWPAEWEPQASVWLAWPRNPGTWPDHFKPVPAEFAQFVRLLAKYEPVNILAGGSEVLEQARSLVGKLKNVTLHDIPTNDAWCRDHGPTFLTHSSPHAPREESQHKTNGAAKGLISRSEMATIRALIDWEYNAWGGKYPPFDLDNEVPRR